MAHYCSESDSRDMNPIREEMPLLAVLAQSPLLRAGLAALLRTLGFEPVEEVADLLELKRRSSEVGRPKMLLVSVPQEDEKLTALIQEIKAWAPDGKVVLLTPAFDMVAMSACFAAGASGYLVENISREGLQYSLQLVSAGENVFPTDLAIALSTSPSMRDRPPNTIGELRNLRATERQIQILQRVAKGESNRSIGKTLGISGTEVSADIKHILRKLRLSNRTQAALWGVARGLVAPLSGLN